VEAFLSEPGRARSGAGGLWIFVGDRPVQDRSLARAVASAYGAALAAGRYPVGAVFVALPPDLVDVNVHPQKAEVRFAHARAVTDALHQVLGAQLSQSLDLAPSATRAAATQPWHGGTASHGSAVSHRSAVSTEEDGWTWSGASAAIEPRPPRGAVTTDARAHDARRADGLRYVGRAGDHFLLFEDADAVLFVDARRAARATLSARAKAEWGEGRLVAQRLLFPATVAVGKTEAEAVERHSGLLARLGFDVRRTGPEVIGMHSVPRLLATVAPETLLAVPLAAIAAGTLDDDVGGCIEAMAKIAAEARRIDEREPLDRAAIAAGTVDRVTLGSLRGDR
jgi:DNA mismatch repair protein MutL